MIPLTPRRRGLYRPPGLPKLIRGLTPRGMRPGAGLAFVPDFTGATWDMLSGRRTTAVGNAGLAVSPAGAGLGQTGLIQSTYLSYAPANVFSLEVLFFYQGDGTVCSFTATPPSGSASYDRVIWFYLGVPKFQIYTGVSQIAAGNAVAANSLVHLVGVSDGTNIYLYQNGKLVATHAGGTAYAGNNYFAIGDTNHNPDNAGSTRGVILAVNYAEVAWSAAEVMGRYVDPFIFYEYAADFVASLLASPPPPAAPRILQTAVSM